MIFMNQKGFGNVTFLEQVRPMSYNFTAYLFKSFNCRLILNEKYSRRVEIEDFSLNDGI